MKSDHISTNGLFGLAAAIIVFAATALADTHIDTSSPDESGGSGWFFVFVLVLAALGSAAYLWMRSKKGDAQPKFNYGSRYSDYYKNESYDIEDGDKELEWLRKAKKPKAKPAGMTFGPKSRTAAPTRSTGGESLTEQGAPDTKVFQEKMRKLQYSRLPINSFFELSESKPYQPLPESNDKSLLNAIDQASEEYEEDEQVRELAVRILTAFRTRNSVESLSQIALYDLSSNLRSKAVSILTDFDHESVFEAILLACADPTREVRAAAARGLFRLSFDRADAWKRIIETNDEFRMSHAARAAIESGIAVKSLDRLIHEDLKVAYEAFALVSLMIRAGETAEIFAAIRTHRDERVKFALLHVIKVHKDERTLAGLLATIREGQLSPEVAERINETMASFEQVKVR
jgi:hypothetical protein